MRMLVLGCGMQGKAVLHDLARSNDVEKVVVADCLERELDSTLFPDKSKLETVVADLAQREQLAELMEAGFDVVIDMLPPQFAKPVAEVTIESGIHFINTNYGKSVSGLHALAEAHGVILLPECGLDPGIDLVLCGEAVRRFDEVNEMKSYGGGIPEKAAATNPLQYKITWRFEGVLDSYAREAKLLREGDTVIIAPERIFDKESIHTVEIPDVGELEAIPNGDAVQFADTLGIEETVLSMGRYSLRWPGHSSLWKKLSGLGFLDDKPISWLAEPLSPRQFLRQMLEPQLQLGPDERDMTILRVDTSGALGGEQRRLLQHVVDQRDLQTGFTAMSRTVGYTASIVAQMICRSEITGCGLLTPVCHIPYDRFADELKMRGIVVSTEWIELD